MNDIEFGEQSKKFYDELFKTLEINQVLVANEIYPTLICDMDTYKDYIKFMQFCNQFVKAMYGPYDF